MKRFSLLLGLIVFLQAMVYSQPCLPEGIIFTSQSQIDSFPFQYPICTNILGDVEIGGGSYSNITNLNGLSDITDIGGGLYIHGCSNLYNLSGLNSLTSIGGYLYIAANVMTDLSGLDNVLSIGGDLIVVSNEYLQSLAGLDNLDAATIADLTITNNPALSMCNTESICDYLSSPGGAVTIFNNAAGCKNPPEVAECGQIILPCLPFGNYYIFEQAEIDSFQTNYPGCYHLSGHTRIRGNDITSLAGFSGITSVNGTLDIEFNDLLQDLEGLNNVNKISGTLSIEYNDILNTVSGLENVDSIGGSLFILINPNLTTIAALQNLRKVGRDLFLDANSSMPNLEGLNNLTLVGGQVYLGYNHSLTDLTALTSLVSIGGDLTIYNNGVLTSLAGLDNIDANSIQNLRINQNSSLSTCEVASVCNYLASPGGYVYIANNAPGCNSQEEVEEACEVIGINEVSQKNLYSIYPNPADETIRISCSNGEQVKSIKIYNSTGQSIQSIEYKTNTVDVSTLKPGLYFIELNLNGKLKYERIAIQ